MASNRASSQAEPIDPLDTQPQDLVCKLERAANPRSRANAMFCTEAHDHIEIQPEGTWETESQEHTSSIILQINFTNQGFTLKDVLTICYAISRHDAACRYTLQQYNCYFFCWNIVLSLSRRTAEWGDIFSSSTVTEACRTKLQHIQTSHPQNNIVFQIAGDYIPGYSRPAFVDVLLERYCTRPWHEEFLNLLDSALWTGSQAVIIGDALRILLAEVAELTETAILKGTNEPTIQSLYRRSSVYRLGLPEDAEASIRWEFNRLVSVYLSSQMWEPFKDALLQTNRNIKQGRLSDSNGSVPGRSLVEQIQYSQVALGARLFPLGIKRVVKGARAAADVYVDNSRGTSSLPKPLVPIQRALKTMEYAPNQLANIAQIAGPFLEHIAMKLEDSKNTDSPLKIKGWGSNALNMVERLDIRSEAEILVVSELEESIKNIADDFPDCDPRTLRLATIQLLIDLKNKGSDLNLELDPKELWRLAIWYSLGDALKECIVEAVPKSELGLMCTRTNLNKKPRQRVTGSMSYTEIQKFISVRIKDLCGMAFKDEFLFELAESQQTEIESAMLEIWQGSRVDWNAV